MYRLYRPLFGLVMAAALALPATAQTTQSFCSVTPVTIPAAGNTIGAPSPYPTTIAVSGVSGTVTDVNISIAGLSHSNPGDLDVFVEAPTLENVWLFSDQANGTPATDVNIVFDDEEPNSQPIPFSGPLTSRTYIPANVGTTSDMFDAPAPTPSGSVTLADFYGDDPNGTWTLWSDDDATNNTGEYDGWCVIITSEGGGPVTIAEARAAGTGTEVTISGVVTRARGAFTYLQDGSAGITVRQTSGAFFDDVASGAIAPGTQLTITGTTSEFRGLFQINAGDLASYSIDGTTTVPAPQMMTLAEVSEDDEAELIQITDLSTTATGVFAAASNTDVTDATGMGILRVPNADDSVIDGTDVPTNTFTFTGVVGQFTTAVPAVDGYQLMAIDAGDIVEDIVTAPEIAVSPTSVDFGTVDAGSTAQQTVTITNEGDGDLTISDVSLSGDAAFAIASGGAAGTLAPGATQDVVIEFTPIASGAVTGTLTITSDDADEPTVTVSLTGTGQTTGGGTCEYGFDAFAVELEPVPAGGGRVQFVYTIDNTGGAAQNVGVWAVVRNSAGTRIFSRPGRGIMVPTNATVRARYYQTIPGRIAADTYTYSLMAGDYNEDDPSASEVCGMETFTIVKQGDTAAKGTSPLLASDWSDAGTVDVEITEGALLVSGEEVRVGPNPTRGTATFGFALADDADVTLAVYDVQGRTVATVVEGRMEAGAHTATMTEALAPGVYVWQLRAGSRVETGRLTVVR